MTAADPRVELLWWSGCPSWEEARELVRAEMAAAGLDPERLELREVPSDEAAAQESFVGSPTIRVAGRDVQDPGDEPVGLTCRVYRLRDGRISALPDPADVRKALSRAARGSFPRRKSESRGGLEVGADGIGIGELAPELALPGTSGRIATLPMPGEAAATVVAWTCNHCPYALAWHDRLTAAAHDYAGRGVRFLAINSNDAERYPADSPEAMAARYDADEWGMPYLHDETQEAARAFGARTTPDLFVFDSGLRLRYRGAPDADHRDPAQNAAWLRSALDALLAGSSPDPAETEPVGCSIKWLP